VVNKRDKSFKGFTLIELLVVVAVIGILSSVGIMSYNGYIKSSRQSSAKNTLMQIGLAQTEYFSNYSYYYNSSESCADSYSDSDHEDIGDNLFDNIKYIDKSINFGFCIIEDSGNFIAKAVSKDGKCILTIDDSGTVDNSSC
tara:strand:+ start:418 stop:843 length:426 start_codon:yes stop_codon:yes gene_type:complete